MHDHTSRAAALAAAILLTACGGSEKKPDSDATEQTTGDVVAQCNAHAAEAEAAATAFQTAPTGSRASMEAMYLEFIKVRASWEAEDAPCAREGAAVTDRMTIQKQTAAKLSEAEAKGTSTMIDFLSGNVDEARELLKTIFAQGRKQHETTLEAADRIDRAYRNRLQAAFKESKKLGQVADDQTTCVFGDEGKIDPNAEEMYRNFKSVFSGATTVHAVCRIPLPAEKFGGDEGAKMVIVLDDDMDPSNGTIYEGDLGTPEQWGSTQWFSGRFEVPQGPAAQKDAGYYVVRVKAQRPTMGDEDLVHNWFYWHR